MEQETPTDDGKNIAFLPAITLIVVLTVLAALLAYVLDNPWLYDTFKTTAGRI